jgi:hypothetical protein
MLSQQGEILVDECCNEQRNQRVMQRLDRLSMDLLSQGRNDARANGVACFDIAPRVAMSKGTKE